MSGFFRRVWQGREVEAAVKPASASQRTPLPVRLMERTPMPDATDLAAVFAGLYRTNTRGGPWPAIAPTANLCDAFAAWVKGFRIRVLLDVQCSDFDWTKNLPLGSIQYTGVDAVPERIAANRRRFSGPGRDFQVRDFAAGPLPAADMIVCRDALVHLSYADIFRAIATFKQSGSMYLATTTFPDHAANEDVPTGWWRPLNLEREPFRWPTPSRLSADGDSVPGYADKALAVWRLGELPEFGEGF